MTVNILRRDIYPHEPRLNQLYFLKGPEPILVRIVKEVGDGTFIVEAANLNNSISPKRDKLAVRFVNLQHELGVPVQPPGKGGGVLGDPPNKSSLVSWKKPTRDNVGLYNPDATFVNEGSNVKSIGLFTNKVYDATLNLNTAIGTRTFRNCKFSSPGDGGQAGYAQILDYALTAAAGQEASTTILEDCEISKYSQGFSDSPGVYVFKRCYFHDFGTWLVRPHANSTYLFAQCFAERMGNAHWSKDYFDNSQNLSTISGGIVNCTELSGTNFIKSIGSHWYLPIPDTGLNPAPSGQGPMAEIEAIFKFQASVGDIGQPGTAFFDLQGDWIVGGNKTIILDEDSNVMNDEFMIQDCIFNYYYLEKLIETTVGTGNATISGNVYKPTFETIDAWLIAEGGWPAGFTP